MINTMIVDDEKLAIRELERQLESLEGFDVNICGTYCSPAEAIENIETLQPDLVFLDIEMPDMNGLEAAKKILELKPETNIVFVTSYDKYALEAFEVNAADYLLKPVMKDRLAKTLARIKDRQPVREREDGGGNNYSVKTFGGVDLMKNGQPLNIVWRSAKVRELFAYYVNYRDQKLHRTKIFEELWPDMEYERARANFNTCNYQLRKQLSETGVNISIQFSGGYYKLNMCGNICDADIVNDVLGRNTSVSQANVGLVTKAMDCYKGLYCENLMGLWVLSQRYYYENLFLNCTYSVADYFCRQKMYGKCLEYAQKAVEKNSLFEDGWKLILNVLKLCGDMDGYYAVQARMREVFQKELGEVPDI